MKKKSPAVNIAVVSLSNTQPPKPPKPPPQPSGAIIIQIIESEIKYIANFFQVVNICFLRKKSIKAIGNTAREKTNNEVPIELKALLKYILIAKTMRIKIVIIKYCL